MNCSECDVMSLHFLCFPVNVWYLYVWYLVLVCHQYDVCLNYVGNVYIGGLIFLGCTCDNGRY